MTTMKTKSITVSSPYHAMPVQKITGKQYTYLYEM